MQILTLSLWEPWASLVKWQEKEYETRHWPTQHRGLLAIHAAKRRVQPSDFPLDSRYFFEAFGKHGVKDWQADFPYGCVLCVVRLTHCHPTELIRRHVSAKEFAFGNYSGGRYAFKFEMVKVFDEPIPARGAQGFWKWECPIAL